jgi:hypothetical protein
MSLELPSIVLDSGRTATESTRRNAGKEISTYLTLYGCAVRVAPKTAKTIGNVSQAITGQK